MIQKRGLIALIALVLMFSMTLLTACGSQDVAKSEVAYTVHSDAIMGIALDLPQKELEDWTILYGPFDQSVDRGEYAPVDGSYLSFMPMESGVTLFNIQYYSESDWDAWMNSGLTPADITGVSNTEEIGRDGGMVYVYAQPDPDETGISDGVKETYRQVLAMLPTIRASITLTTRGAANTGDLPSFSVNDLSGNAIDNTTFADYEMTVLNIWGTFCGPCIEEMPELEAMSRNMPTGTRLVGLVCDATDEDHIELAKEILAGNSVTYPNWIPDDALIGYLDEHITGVPTTLFIDRNGRIIGDAIIGSQSAEAYLNALNARLATLDDASGTPDTGAVTPAQDRTEGSSGNLNPNGSETGAPQAGAAPAE